MDIDAFVKKGNQADKLIFETEYDKALHKYEELIDTLIHQKEFDCYLLSKSMLGMAIGFVKGEYYQDALELFFGHEESSIFHTGMQGLLNGVVGDEDTMVFLQVLSFISSIADDDQATITEQVNQLMLAVSNYYKNFKPDQLGAALCNWRFYLNEVYDGNIPESAVKKLQKFEKKHTGNLPEINEPILPPPSPWMELPGEVIIKVEKTEVSDDS